MYQEVSDFLLLDPGNLCYGSNGKKKKYWKRCFRTLFITLKKWKQCPFGLNIIQILHTNILVKEIFIYLQRYIYMLSEKPYDT